MKKTTITLDASSLRKGDCLRRLFWEVVTGYKKKGKINNDTHFGTSFHAFRAEYRKTGDEFKGLAEAIKVWRGVDMNVKEKKVWLNEKFLKQTCMDYANQYPALKDNLCTYKDLIEPVTKFVFPFVVEDDIEIMVAGTQDEIGEYKSINQYDGGDGLTIIDAKTSGSWNTWEFFDDANFNPQGKLYRWSVKKYAQFKPDSIWAEIDKSPNVGFMIDGVFYKAPGKDDVVPNLEFKRSKRMVFKDWELEEFEQLFLSIAHTLIVDIRIFRSTGKIPPRYGTLTGLCTNQKFGPCEFCQACGAKDEEAMESWLELNYDKREYNPLMFGGVVK